MLEGFLDSTFALLTLLVDEGLRLINGLIRWGEEARDGVAAFSPTQKVVLWIQFGVGILTVIWIIFQFAWMRRLNEARLEHHLEGTISAERDELADERTTVLAELDRVVKRRGLPRLLLLAWAHIRLTISLVLRLLSLGTTRGLADHNLLLMKVGAEHRARAIFTEIAREAGKRIELYRSAIENKTREAQNALIFAGRVALIEKRHAAAIVLFKKAKSLKEDADARVLIGKQLAMAGDWDGALAEYQAALANADAEAMPFTRSEAHRCIAEVLMQRGARVRARQELDDAQQIDEQHRNYAGLARTHELIGDLFKPRVDRRSAALRAYAEAALNFDRADQPTPARNVRRKSRLLSSDIADVADGWWTRTLERCGGWLLRQVAKRRARAQTKVA